MAWFDVVRLAELHRETYVAILKSWIPHGEKGDFARRVGITQEYFSYLCALDHPIEDRTKTKRLPSPKLARKLAKDLPAPLEIKNSLMENIELAHVNAASAYYNTREFIAERRVDELLAELEQEHRKATFGTDLTEVYRAYRAVRDAAASLIHGLSPDIFPASLAQTCMYLHDAQCVLDRADDALRYASLARFVLENTDYQEGGFTKEEVDNIEINAIRGQGVANHNLGLDRQAQSFYRYARTTSAYRNSHDLWEPFIGRDLIISMSPVTRFSIREARIISHRIRDICEQRDDEFTLFLAMESWLRCLIQREHWHEAQSVFREELDRIPRLPYVGSLHRALLMKSGAELAWKLHDLSTWRERIAEALLLMHRAGLNHQIRTVKQFYDSDIKPVMETLNV